MEAKGNGNGAMQKMENPECRHQLTSVRMKIVRDFLRSYVQNRLAYGSIGSSGWISALLKHKVNYRKLTHDKVNAYDVSAWLRETNYFGNQIAELERELTALHAEAEAHDETGSGSALVAVAVATTTPSPTTTSSASATGGTDGGMSTELTGAFISSDEIQVQSSSGTNPMATSTSSAASSPQSEPCSVGLISYEGTMKPAINQDELNAVPVQNLVPEAPVLRILESSVEPQAGSSIQFQVESKIPLTPAEEKVEAMDTEDNASTSSISRASTSASTDQNTNTERKQDSGRLPAVATFDLKTRITIRKLVQTTERLRNQPSVKNKQVELSLILGIISDLLSKVDPCPDY